MDKEKEINIIYKKLDSPIKKIPGIGDKTGPIIIAEFGNFERFKGGYKKLLAFAGLDPRIRQSGKWQGSCQDQ